MRLRIEVVGGYSPTKPVSCAFPRSRGNRSAASGGSILRGRPFYRPERKTFMLVLSRRVNENVVFPAIDASVQVLSVKAGVVRLGIKAPPEIVVHRQEVHDRAAEWDSSKTPEILLDPEA